MKDIRTVSAMSGQHTTGWGNEEPSIDFRSSPTREDINHAMFQLRSLDGSTGLNMMDWTERLIELTSVSGEPAHQDIATQPCLVNANNVFETVEHQRQHVNFDTNRSFQRDRDMTDTSQVQISSRRFSETLYENTRKQVAYVSLSPSSSTAGSSYMNLFTGNPRGSQLEQSSALPSCKYSGKRHLSSQGKLEQPLLQPLMSDYTSHMSITNNTSQNSITSSTSHDTTQETLEPFGNQTDSNEFNLFHAPVSVDSIRTIQNFNLGAMGVLDSLSSAALIRNSLEESDTTNLSQGTPVRQFSEPEQLMFSQNVCQFSDDFIDFATVEVETTVKSLEFNQQTIANVAAPSTYTGTVTICQTDDIVFNAPTADSFLFKLPSVSASGRPASFATPSEQLSLSSSLARTISSGISLPDDIEDHLVASSSDSQSPWEQFSASIHPWDTGVLSLTDDDMPVEVHSLQSGDISCLDLKTPTDIPRDALRTNVDLSLSSTHTGSTFQPLSDGIASQMTAEFSPEAHGITKPVSEQPYLSQHIPPSGEVSLVTNLTQCKATQGSPCTSSSEHVSSISNHTNILTQQTYSVTLTSTSLESPALHSSQLYVLIDPGSSSGRSTTRHEPRLCPPSAPRGQTQQFLGKGSLSKKIPAVKNPRLSSYPKPNLSDLSSDALLSPGDVNKAFLSSIENQNLGKPQAPLLGMSSETSDVSLQDSDASSSVSTSLTEGEGSGERSATQNLKEKLRFRLKGKSLPSVDLKSPEEGRSLDTGSTSVPMVCQMTNLPRRKRYNDVDTDSSSASRTKSSRRSSSSTMSVSSDDDHDISSDSQNLLRDDKKPNKKSGNKEGAAGGDGDEEVEEEDEETRLAKREKNRLAAQKCRHMKRDKMLMLSKQVYRLEERQSRIKSEVERLNEEREQLEEMLRVHAFICKRQDQSSGDHSKSPC